MKRIALLSIIFALVVSLTAPTGAAFAFEEDGAAEPVLLESDPQGEDVVELEPSEEAPLVVTVPPVVEVVEAEPPREPLVLPESLSLPVIVTPADAPVVAEPTTTPPLVITTFDVSDGLEFVELYNQSGAPIAVDQVRLQASVGGGSCSVGIADKGFIMPDEFFYAQSQTYQGDNGFSREFSGECLATDAITRIELFVSNTRVQLIDGIAISATMWAGHSGAWPKGVRKDFTSIKQSGSFGKDYVLISAGQAIYSSGTYTPSVSAGGLKIVEILPNSRSCAPGEIGSDCDDYIKVHNDSDSDINLVPFRLRVGSRSANATVTTSFHWQEPTLHPARDELILPAGAYFSLQLRDDGALLSLSNGESHVWLEDYFGVVTYQSVSYVEMDLAAARGKSWAYNALNDIWQFGVPSPHGANVLYVAEEEPGRGSVDNDGVKPCGSDQYRNEETNRCRNIAAPSTLTPCREGQYRSEETNRCRSLAATVASVLKPCSDDQFRNPTTNRCKKIASADDLALADCGEGRERNPLTNRCRNVTSAGTLADTMPFPVEKIEEGTERFAGWWTLGIVALAGASYGMWEWREELLRIGRKAGRFISRSK